MRLTFVEHTLKLVRVFLGKEYSKADLSKLETFFRKLGWEEVSWSVEGSSLGVFRLELPSKNIFNTVVFSCNGGSCVVKYNTPSLYLGIIYPVLSQFFSILGEEVSYFAVQYKEGEFADIIYNISVDKLAFRINFSEEHGKYGADIEIVGEEGVLSVKRISLPSGNNVVQSLCRLLELIVDYSKDFVKKYMEK